MRSSWVYINGVAYEKGTEPRTDGASSIGLPTILPDLPDFISPIDGSVVHGRAGLREHCLKHNVVPTADLKGLPLSPRMTSDSLKDIKEVMLKKGYWDRKNEYAK